jgi:hypothetical protein
VTHGEGEPDRMEAPAALEAGARELRWAPRVPPHKVRRLYETDALGIVDGEQIDAVGYALLARCESILAVTEAHDAGRLRCPRCRTPIQRRGTALNPEDDAEVIRCGACGWATTGRALRLSYRGKQLYGPKALPDFRAYVAAFPRAATPRQRMLAIDRLIHAVHGDLARGDVGRPVGVSVLAGNREEIVRLLDGLAVGGASTPGLQEGRAAWEATKTEAARYSDAWRSEQVQGPGEAATAAHPPPAGPPRRSPQP